MGVFGGEMPRNEWETMRMIQKYLDGLAEFHFQQADLHFEKARSWRKILHYSALGSCVGVVIMFILLALAK